MRCIVFVLMALLSGCAGLTSDPWLKDVLTNPETTEFVDEETTTKVSYAARYLMESDDRAELEAEFKNSDLVRRWSAGQYALAAQMGTDVVVGKVGSSLGASVGNKVWGAGLIAGEILDGSRNIISQAWLPEKYQGEVIDSVDAANSALAQMVVQRVKHIAKAIGWSYQCVYKCSSLNQIMLLSRGEKAINPGYIYWPQYVFISTNVGSMEPVKAGDPISSVLGFPAKWQTPLGNTFLVYFYAEPGFYQDGSPKIAKGKKTGLMFPVARRELTKTHFGRDLLKMFHHDTYSLFGTSDLHPKQIWHNGSIYSFISNSSSRMVDRVINESSLLSLN